MKSQPKNDRPVLFDVDGTLIIPAPNRYIRPKDSPEYIAFNYYGSIQYHKPKPYIVDLLKAHYARGIDVHVMSANGKAWVDEVLAKLGLTEYVAFTSGKYAKYFDDMHADTWMTHVDVSKIDV